MDLGVTVGDDLDRLAASPARFDFCELGVGEPTLVPGEIDPGRLTDALAGRDLVVHLPYSQRLASYVPEVNDAIVDYQRRLLDAAGDLGAAKAVLHATSADRDDVDFRETAAAQLRTRRYGGSSGATATGSRTSTATTCAAAGTPTSRSGPARSTTSSWRPNSTASTGRSP